MKISIIILIILVVSDLALAEDLLLTSNRWLSGGSMKARIYCSLRGENISTGSISCSTEVMETLNDRFSHNTDRKHFGPEGNFEYSSDEKTALGQEIFYLSGQVIQNGPVYEIAFTKFVHALKIFEMLPVFSVEYKDFSSSTEKFSTTSYYESHEPDPKGCIKHRDFQIDRIPGYCQFHGFAKSNVDFPIFCEKVGIDNYLVRTKSTCLD